MVKISVTDLSGETRNIDAEPGLSLMESIRENDFDDLVAICGGCCSCCTCHVYIDEGAEKLPAMQDDEHDLLEDSVHYREGESRLSCQLDVSDDMTGLCVTIAPES